MFVSHFSSESTAKDCKLHKIVASQGAINIDNLVKFAHLLCAPTTLGWFKCFGGSGAGRGVYGRREFFFQLRQCCFIGQNRLLLLHLTLVETLSPVLSSEQIRCQGVSTPRHLLFNWNGEMLKLEQHNHSNSLHHLCREKLDLRAEGGLLDTGTSLNVDPGFGPSTWLAHKNQNAVTTLLLRKTEKLRPSGTRRCYKSSRGPSGGRGTLQYYCCHFKWAWLLFLLCSLVTVTTVARPVG